MVDLFGNTFCHGNRKNNPLNLFLDLKFSLKVLAFYKLTKAWALNILFATSDCSKVSSATEM